jgi:hypothetical protein
VYDVWFCLTTLHVGFTLEMRLIRLISFPARETFTSTSLFLLVGVMALSTLRAFDCSSPSSSSLLVPTNYVVAYQHGHPFNCNDETSPMHGVSVFFCAHG